MISDFAERATVWPWLLLGLAVALLVFIADQNIAQGRPGSLGGSQPTVECAGASGPTSGLSRVLWERERPNKPCGREYRDEPRLRSEGLWTRGQRP